jgi:hypothetical protein
LFLEKAAKLKWAKLEWSQLGEGGLGRGGDEQLVPMEALPILDTAERLRAVVSGTMGDKLNPQFRELIASYGESLTAVLAYARTHLGQKYQTVPTWKEHILVCHFPSWLEKRNDGTLEGGKVRRGGEMRGASAYAEQTGESCHSFFDDFVWSNFKKNDNNPR